MIQARSVELSLSLDGALSIPVGYDYLYMSNSNYLLTYLDTAILQGNFRNRHAGCHSIADMAEVVGGPIVRELVGGLFIIAV